MNSGVVLNSEKASCSKQRETCTEMAKQRKMEDTYIEIYSNAMNNMLSMCVKLVDLKHELETWKH
jgi:hypothetical protein